MALPFQVVLGRFVRWADAGQTWVCRGPEL